MKAGEVCINDIFNGARLIEVPFTSALMSGRKNSGKDFLRIWNMCQIPKGIIFLGLSF